MERLLFLINVNQAIVAGLVNVSAAQSTLCKVKVPVRNVLKVAIRDVKSYIVNSGCTLDFSRTVLPARRKNRDKVLIPFIYTGCYRSANVYKLDWVIELIRVKSFSVHSCIK